MWTFGATSEDLYIRVLVPDVGESPGLRRSSPRGSVPDVRGGTTRGPSRTPSGVPRPPVGDAVRRCEPVRLFRIAARDREGVVGVLCACVPSTRRSGTPADGTRGDCRTIVVATGVSRCGVSVVPVDVGLRSGGGLEFWTVAGPLLWRIIGSTGCAIVDLLVLWRKV